MAKNNDDIITLVTEEEAPKKRVKKKVAEAPAAPNNNDFRGNSDTGVKHFEAKVSNENPAFSPRNVTESDENINFYSEGGEETVVTEVDSTPSFTFRASEPKTRTNATTCTVNTTARFEVVVMSPTIFDDAKEIADYLGTKNPVVINLENCEKDVTRRIIDFLSGAVYAVKGNIQKISNDIFLVTPYNVSILGNFKDDVRKTVLPWESGNSDYR